MYNDKIQEKTEEIPGGIKIITREVRGVTSTGKKYVEERSYLQAQNGWFVMEVDSILSDLFNAHRIDYDTMHKIRRSNRKAKRTAQLFLINSDLFLL